MSDPIPDDLARALAASSARRGRFGDPFYFFSETGSTNDVAELLAEHGAPEGATVVAFAQTAGRGRFGRTWFSPAGAGLYVSIVCRNEAAAPLLTLAGGVAVAGGIRAATGLPVQIKWPNDIVVADRTRPARRRKLAGLLAEASSGGDGLQYVILGFGINLRPAAYPPDLADRATSIETELGRSVDGALVLAETLASFAGSFERLAAGDARHVLTASADNTARVWDPRRRPFGGVGRHRGRWRAARSRRRSRGADHFRRSAVDVSGETR